MPRARRESSNAPAKSPEPWSVTRRARACIGTWGNPVQSTACCTTLRPGGKALRDRPGGQGADAGGGSGSSLRRKAPRLACWAWRLTPSWSTLSGPGRPITPACGVNNRLQPQLTGPPLALSLSLTATSSGGSPGRAPRSSRGPEGWLKGASRVAQGGLTRASQVARRRVNRGAGEDGRRPRQPPAPA